MENPANLKDQIAQRIKDANNVLVTVSNDPSPDQLAAAIGFTLLLNKLGKHGTAVFSGKIPSTIEFLEPEKTLETNTDSLRDFIIALDKSKADKLRYKVEDKLVKIFITPYKTSLSDKDLEFSQGDFNVDVVVALGVKQREQIDQAIVAHGRILHDATVISINNDSSGEVGSINWVNTRASSLCEMVVSVIEAMKDGNLLDNQMATALLTGIVAETERFSNAKTSPETMGVSSRLMAAGANQQLIATKLQSELAPSPANRANTPPTDLATASNSPDGALQIEHSDKTSPAPPPVPNDDPKDYIDQIEIDEHGTIMPPETKPAKNADTPSGLGDPKLVITPPTLGGTLTANSRPEGLDPSTDPMTLPPVNSPLLDHRDVSHANSVHDPLRHPKPVNDHDIQTNKVEEAKPAEESPQTLTDLEKFVSSPHLASEQLAGHQNVPAEPKTNGPKHDPVMVARNAVTQAITTSPNQAPEPIAALNANPIDLNMGHDDPNAYSSDKAMPQVDIDDNTGVPQFSMPSNLMPTSTPTDSTAGSTQPGSPPPVPPPMIPPPYGDKAPVADEGNPLAPPVM